MILRSALTRCNPRCAHSSIDKQSRNGMKGRIASRGIAMTTTTLSDITCHLGRNRDTSSGTAPSTRTPRKPRGIMVTTAEGVPENDAPCTDECYLQAGTRPAKALVCMHTLRALQALKHSSTKAETCFEESVQDTCAQEDAFDCAKDNEAFDAGIIFTATVAEGKQFLTHSHLLFMYAKFVSSSIAVAKAGAELQDLTIG